MLSSHPRRLGGSAAAGAISVGKQPMSRIGGGPREQPEQLGSRRQCDRIGIASTAHVSRARRVDRCYECRIPPHSQSGRN
jgi:hypothetical protein